MFVLLKTICAQACVVFRFVSVVFAELVSDVMPD